MPNKQQTVRFKFSRPKQALVFLVFAALIWLLSTLSESYNATVPVRVELVADDAHFLVLSPRIVVPAQMYDTGFSIIYHKLVPKELSLSTSDLPKLDINRPVVSANFLLEKYREQYPKSRVLNGFEVRSVALPISIASQKSFAPTLTNPPLFADGYHLTSTLKFSVDSVTASGSQMVIDNLENAVFKLESNNILKDDFSISATLLDSLEVLAKWSTKSLYVTGSVDRYSDVSFVLPISVVDTSEIGAVKISPTQVEVKFAAPFSELRALNASSLFAEVVFEPTESGKLPVNITGLPSTIKKLSIEPSTVSYFILE